MKIITMLFIILFPAGILCAEQKIEDNELTREEAYILVKQLTALKSVKDDLKHMQEWSGLMYKFSEPQPESYNRMTIYLLTAYISRIRGRAGSSEIVTEDIGPIYQNKPELFLRVLNRNSYMAPVICDFLIDHYIWVKGLDPAKQFIDKEKPRIEKRLNSKNSSICISIFNKSYVEAVELKAKGLLN